MTREELPRLSTFSRLQRIAGVLLAHSLALFFVYIMLCKIVPTYTIFFEHQNLALPEATRRIVMLSEFCIAYWFILVFVLMFADAAVVFLLALAASRKSWVLSAYSHLCLLAASAALVYVAAWLSHPVYGSVR